MEPARMRIPVRRATTLTGMEVTVPQDFTGERNAVLLAEDPSGLVVFPSWCGALAEVQRTRGLDVGLYALALIPQASWIYRGITAWTLRLQYAQPFEQEHIALVYCDIDVWRAQAGISATSEPVLVVCDQMGEVYAHTRGGPASTTVPRILAAMEAE